MIKQRPRFIRCAACDKRVRIGPTGTVAKYCSNRCRQAAFAARNEPKPKLGERARMWRLLQDAGLVPLDRPLPPPREHNKRQTRATSKRARQVGAAAAVMLALLLSPADALAQQRTIYGSDGRASGRSTTDSGGATTTYGPDGRATGRTSTGSDGTVTIYGADGRKAGTVTTPQKRERER
jgi:hypothetical protein